MDKYLIKTARNSPERVKLKKNLPKYKQTTIESLQRVVVVEEMVQAKSILSLSGQSIQELTNCLIKLNKCIPSKDVLLETKLGRVVNKLRKHEDTNVQALATKLLKKWKQFYREQKQRLPIEVRSDKNTESFRRKAKGLISSALKTGVSDYI